MSDSQKDIIAIDVQVKGRVVFLNLEDGSTHSFPTIYYPRLAGASDALLEKVVLRVGGRALRWEALDEDIWIQDAVCQKYPKSDSAFVADSAIRYPVNPG